MNFIADIHIKLGSSTKKKRRIKVSGKGLEGIVVDSSSISCLLPQTKSLIYRGYPIGGLVQNKTYSEIVLLIWNGELPNEREVQEFEKSIKNNFIQLEPEIKKILEVVKTLTDAHPMDVLRTAISLLGSSSKNTWNKSVQDIREKGLQIMSLIPVVITAHYRFRKGMDYIPPRKEGSIAQNFLYMYYGRDPSDLFVKAFDRSLSLYAEHGFNASTFAARAITSTTSDVFSAICGAIGSLKGPLHGGANEQVMYMMKEIGEPSKVEEYLLQAIKEKRKIMGFGHRVYKQGDARVPHMYECAKIVASECKNTKWLDMYALIKDYMKQTKNLNPNVDFPAGPAYYMMGIDIPLYTPIFAMARMAGWIAHIIEQSENNRIIRPMSEYIGPSERHL